MRRNLLSHIFSKTFVKVTVLLKKLTLKIFRQINSLVTYLVKPLLSRNFCQNRVRVNFRNFHIVTQLHFYGKNFVKAVVILKKLLKSWFDGKWFWWEKSSSHTVLKNCKNLSLAHFFDKNFVNVTFLLQKFLRTWFNDIFSVWENFSLFHSTVNCVEKWRSCGQSI